MRRILIALMSTVAAVVLVFSFDASRRSPTVVAVAPAAPAASAADQATAAASTSQTFTGELAQTRWGPVQVRIVVSNGKIVSAKAVEYPQDNPRDVEINSWAIPKLEQATVDSNGQDVDSYSGATVTSEGYLTSLQSALDQANL
jgi:uncharacterized protein with FMN-binding domain